MSASLPAPYLVTLGETMALLTAQHPGPLAHVSSMSLGIGGSESNVAIGVQRLGGNAVWCGRTGTDSLGQLVRREIRAEGVTVLVTEDPDAPTGLMLKERRTLSTQKVSYYRAGSAGSRLTPEDLDPSIITGAAILHLSGITPALSASAASAVREAIGIARSAGVTVSFDLNYRANLWTAVDAGRSYLELIPLTDIVFAGDEEAALAVGAAEDPAELAQRLAELGPAQAIIKLGSKGAVASIDGQIHHQPAVPIEPVDTVGAGDAFVAGYLAELMAGKAPSERLELAAKTGAFACLAYGDWEGLPTRAELALLHHTESVTR
ncbi:sugar kinase [Arthrobacter cheniae]|nr:sugar kinase [Arthrobacter cheniae]